MTPVMKRVLLHISIYLSAVLLLYGCIQDIFIRPDIKDSELIDYTICFGSPKGAEVNVSTKGDLGLVRESNVFNLYLFIFNSSGNKIYGHYFTGDNLKRTAVEATNAGLTNWWKVTNMATASSDPTSGELHIKTTATDNCTIVAIANLNPNDLDVSAGLLSTISSYSALNELVATQVRSEVIANSGYFMMTGEVNGVNIGGENPNIDSKTLILKRIYAKVTFNVRVAPQSYGADTTKVKSFTPYKWQLIRVPACSYLLVKPITENYTTSINGETKAIDAADTDDEFFDTETSNFEKETLTTTPNDYYINTETPVSIHSFTFYMMENRKKPASGISSYADREKQVSGTDPGRAFKYANAYSTYVIITGKVEMEDTYAMEATVQYKIHLGNFSSSNTNFDTERNHNYVYNINIYGVNNIVVEVEEGTENEPGATGTVLVANEKIYTSDCHYSTQVISFHAAKLPNSNDPNSKDITWYVETPFNREGIQYYENPSDPTDNNLGSIDYKWIEFRRNKLNNSNLYTDNRVRYYPHPSKGIFDWSSLPSTEPRTMYVNEVVNYLKEQKYNYDHGLANDFDNTPAGQGGPKISLTAFVDEFYYTERPIGAGGWDPNLWKDYVVNQPMRKMHIMASSTTSADGESNVIGSSFTIQQRSIQSIYAIHETADLESAWGMEFIDDFEDETGTGATYWSTRNYENCGNTSPTNGRLNTMKLWGVLNPDGTTPSGPQLEWETFLNLYTKNESAQLWTGNKTIDGVSGKTNYRFLRYSCMSRNRDNDGDGYIDPEEIRWYMASDIQLIGVFLGSYGIEGAARLYQRSAINQTSSDKNVWRQHVVASNIYQPLINTNSNDWARVIWAEEGINGTSIHYTQGDQTKTFSTRCVRNMGYYINNGVRVDISDADANYVEPNLYVKYTRKKYVEGGDDIDYPTGPYTDDVYYEFDCSRINLASLREPLDHELVGHDENSRMACLARGFRTIPVNWAVDLSGKTAYVFNGKTYNLTQYAGLNNYLDDCFGEMDTNFSVCPDGYRLPNVRELSVIWNIITNFIPDDGDYLLNTQSGNNSVPCRTYWSFGMNGSGKMSSYWGWSMITNKLQMSIQGQHIAYKPRCVKDL